MSSSFIIIIQLLNMDSTSNTLNKCQRHIYLVFLIGVPGLGKTSLINKLKETCQESSRLCLEITRSDEVRSAIVAQEYSARGLDVHSLTQEQIFQVEVESGPRIKEELNKDICSKLNKLQEDQADRKIFVLDKNYCTKALINYIEERTNDILSDCQVHKMVIIPQTFGDSNKVMIGPFDFDTLVIGLIRSLTRQNHITMNHGEIHTLLSFFSCLQSQASDSFEEKFPQEQFTRVQVPYYHEYSVKNFKASGNHSDQFDRLRQVVTEIALKKAQVKDHVMFICSTINQLKQMNSFVDYDEASVNSVLSNILAA